MTGNNSDSIDAAIGRVAAGCGGDPDRLRDSVRLRDAAGRLDPAAPDYDTQVGRLVTEQIDQDPARFRTGPQGGGVDAGREFYRRRHGLSTATPPSTSGASSTSPPGGAGMGQGRRTYHGPAQRPRDVESGRERYRERHPHPGGDDAA